MLHLAPELTGSMRPSDGPHAVIRPIDGATGARRAGDQAGAPLDPSSAEARRAAGLPPEGWSLEGLAPCCWITSEFSASGVLGSAEGASADLGERLYQRLVEGWRRRLDALLRSDWPPTSGAG
jgi:creatinine amidohydrolase/Fe(II)-dependent formamide hydrolase-like protein